MILSDVVRIQRAANGSRATRGTIALRIPTVASSCAAARAALAARRHDGHTNATAAAN